MLYFRAVSLNLRTVSAHYRLGKRAAGKARPASTLGFRGDCRNLQSQMDVPERRSRGVFSSSVYWPRRADNLLNRGVFRVRRDPYWGMREPQEMLRRTIQWSSQNYRSAGVAASEAAEAQGLSRQISLRLAN